MTKKKSKTIYSARRRQQILPMIESLKDSSIELKKSQDPLDIAEMMFKIVEHLFVIPREEFLNEGRARDHVIRRCLIANLIGTFTDIRDYKIGELLGRDRTTILHMFRVHDDLIYSDKVYKDWFERASSLYARSNYFPKVDNVTMDSIIEKIIKINEDVEELNAMLGNLLVNTKSLKDVSTTDQALTD